MFIKITKQGYTRDGSAFAHGRFLVLCQREGWANRNVPIRAFVVYARMSQWGHFMMARARKAGVEISLSGTYGNDGLPRDVPESLYDIATPVPADLVDAWNIGGGWNSAGNEADAMRQWARDTFKI